MSKTWAELTRRQRREVRSYLRWLSEPVHTMTAHPVPDKEAVSAALRQLSEPRKDKP